MAETIEAGHPIDEGVLGFQTRYPAAVVSPAYGIWKLKRPAETHIPFIERYLRSSEARTIYAKKMRGAVARRRSISRDAFLEIEIPFPPFDEQLRITAVLDKTDALRRMRQESLQLTETLLRSVFIHMFGDPVTNPRGWPLEPLAKLGTLDRGVSKHRPRNAPELLGGKYPLIQTGEVSNAGLYIRRFTHSYSDLGFKQSKMWPKGTLCITIAANIAQTAILDFDACFPDSVVGFTPHEGVCTSVYVHFLFGFLQKILETTAPQAAQKNINLAILRALEVPRPPFTLQKDFEMFVMKAVAVLDDQGDSLEIINMTYRSIQQRAYRGELDLSRLVLDSSDDAYPTSEPETLITKEAESNAPRLFLLAPQATEATLKELDDAVGKGEPIPWSADYFKYRILAAQAPPFTFTEVMQKAESVFNDPPYGEIRDMILDLLGQGGRPAVLNQTFDLHVDAETKELSGRKEMVFRPVA